MAKIRTVVRAARWELVELVEFVESESLWSWRLLGVMGVGVGELGVGKRGFLVVALEGGSEETAGGVVDEGEGESGADRGEEVHAPGDFPKRDKGDP